jgi:TonB-linked SusC/RagA family outer membrane protein
MKSIHFIFIVLLTGLFIPSQLNAQRKQKSNTVIISSNITDVTGKPISNATIHSQEGKALNYSNSDGSFSIECYNNENILIEAENFQPLIVDSKSVNRNSKIILIKNKLLSGENDIVNLPFGDMIKRKITGAVQEIDVEKVKKTYTAWNYSNLLRSEGFGLFGSNNIRGNGYTVLIDGFVRDGNSDVTALSDLLNTTEIEKITVLKDVTSRLLYGSLSDAGIVMITTKRGEAFKRKINIQYEGSAGYAIEYPNYLNAADYMYLYNEALRNDGLAPRYSNDDIANTRTGFDPVRYPDISYYNSTFLREVKPQHMLSTEFSGGNNTAQYYLTFGWYNTSSAQTIGQAENQTTNRFNVRGAVDVKVNDFIKVDVGALAVFNAYQGINSKDLNFWELSTTERPNAYPLLIPVDRIISADRKTVDDAFAQKSVINNSYLLGGSSVFTQNVYGDLLLAGYNNTISRNSQLNLGIEFDLKKLVKGLSLTSNLGYDNYNTYRISQVNSYAVYEPTFLDNDSISVKAIGVNNFVGSQSIGGVNFYRRMSWSNVLSYMQQFNNLHEVDVTAMSLISSYKQNNFMYNQKTANFGIRANYMYDGKYIAEVTGMLLGSPRFAKAKQWGFSPAVGLGWMVSEEEFMKNNTFFEYLKLKTSFGNTKTDNDDALDSYYMYQNVYNVGGNFNYGDGLGQNGYLVVQTGNPNLSWVERNELNAGLEASLLKDMLSFEINYFRSLRFNEIQRLTNTYPQFMGGNNFIAYENYAKRVQNGFEAEINFNKQINDFKISVDFNIINLVPTRLLLDELNYGPGYEYRQRQGKVNDGLWGLVANGLYTQDEIDLINNPNDKTIPKPGFGSVNAGDIKYSDIDNDGFIDDKDVILIGNSQARFNYGLRINLSYRNLNLFVFGTAETGYHRFHNNSYSWVFGERKYPTHLVTRWAYNPELNVDTRETATYPRLTTKNNTNNFRNSTFWLTSRDYFSIPALQLTYNFSRKISEAVQLRNLSLYARVNNLITISVDKYATLNVGSSPQLRMYNVGIRADL